MFSSKIHNVSEETQKNEVSEETLPIQFIMDTTLYELLIAKLNEDYAH